MKYQLGFHVGIDDQVVPASIYATGPGELLPRFSCEASGNQRYIHNSLTDLGYSDGEDIAVVLIPSLAGNSCLRLASTNSTMNDSVRTISYPCFKSDRNDWPQDRRSKVLLSTYESSQMIEGFPVSKGNFLVTHKTQDCNSGSPVLNTKGEISGVICFN